MSETTDISLAADTGPSAHDVRAAGRKWLGLALVALVVIAYSPAFRAGFIWDDDAHVTDNANLHSFQGLYRIWSEPSASQQYYPLQLTSYWVEYHLWGLRPFGYHAVNVLLHALSALLLWMVLQQLDVPGAWLAAAVFAVHPVQVESVAWVSELKNLLSTTFYLGSLLAFFRFRPMSAMAQADSPPWRFYLLAIALFLCALLSKTVACSLPAVLALLLWWKRGHLERRDIEVLSPMLLLGIALGLMTAWLEKHNVGACGAEWRLSFVQRCLVAGRALCFYTGKLFWPRNLTFVYPRWNIDVSAAWQYSFPVAALVVLITLWLLRSRIGRGPLVAVLCFAGILVPALGFFDVFPFRYSYVADHFQYLASAAMIALSVAAVTQLRIRTRSLSAVLNRWTGALVLAALTALSIRQCATYASAESLYRATISRNPTCWLAYNNLGGLLLERGQLDEAIQILQLGLKFKTDDGGVYNNLGNAFFRQGRYAEATDQYREAVKLKPDYPEAHYNLGNALSKLNHLEEAAAQYREAIRLEPDYADAHYNLANTLTLENQVAEATQHYQLAARLQPHDADIRYVLANVLAQQGDFMGAVSNYLFVVQLKPDFADAYYNLANTLAQLGRIPDALASYRRAVELNPALLPAQFNFATTLLASGNAAESIEHFQRAIVLKPDFPLTYYKLGIAWVRLGRFDDATNSCEHALQLSADSPQSLADCAWLLATHAGTTPQDAARALSFADRACQLTRNTDPPCLAALAAAYASTGQFTNAVATIEAAVELLGSSNPAQDHLPFLDQRNSYRAGQPYIIRLPASLPSDW